MTAEDPAIRELVSTRRDGYGLPRDFYQDTALYAYELEHIWRRGWIFAGHTCEIAEPGDYFTLAVADDSLLVIRGDDATVRAFHNICTHRGTILRDDEKGHARAIACPYHQWTFSPRGDLISCAGMQQGIDRNALGLHPVHVETSEGLIFLSLVATPPPFEPARGLMAPFAHPQGLVQAKVAAVRDYTVHANWKLVWENNRECYHCNVNHPHYIKSNFDIYEEGQHSDRIHQRMVEALAHSEEMRRGEDLAITHARGGLAPFPDADHDIWYSANRTVLVEGWECESLDGRRVAPLMGTYRDAFAGVLRMRTLPNFWMHASCDHAVTTRLLPDGIRDTKIRVSWLVHQAAREGVDYQIDQLTPFWQYTSEQDWTLCERVQRGVNSTAYQPGPLSTMREYNLDAFLRWYLRRLQ